VERPQLVRGIDAELLGQDRASSVEGHECLRLPARAVQGEHQLGPQALAEAVRADQGLELGDDVGVATELELCADLVLDRLQAELLQPDDLAGERGLVG